MFSEIKTDYEIPNATVEILWPRGFRVSIPDETGIVSFTFNGKINEMIYGRERGQFSKVVTKVTEGRWVFEDRNATLEVGDVIYYWIKVEYINGDRKIEYYKDNQDYRITGSTDNLNIENAQPAASTATPMPTTKLPYQLPNITVQAFTSRGFKISIPHEEGIQLFSVRINAVNEAIIANVTQPVNGYWTYLNKNIKLILGNFIYYRVRVYYYDGEHTLVFEKEESFAVQELIPDPDEVVSTTIYTTPPSSSFTTSENRKEYKIPNVIVQALKPIGLKISIPHEEGIQLFSIMGKLSEEANDRDEVNFSKNITHAVGGYWTYLNKQLLLQLGDIVYYSVAVTYFNGIRSVQYYKDSQVYIVNGLISDQDQHTPFIPTTTALPSVKIEYKIPHLNIEPLWPKGLLVSFPNEKGVVSFAFHANINDRIQEYEDGTISQETTQTNNLNLLFEFITLEPGDVIYYWVKVDYYDGKQIQTLYKSNQVFVVKELFYGKNLSTEKSSTQYITATTTTTTTTKVPTHFEIPEIIITPIRSKGLRVSVPDRNGIRLVAFHANINQKIGTREEGEISKVIVEAVKGFWTFFDENLKLNVGDEIYYWVQVDCFDGRERVEHYKDDQIFVASEDKFSDLFSNKFGEDKKDKNEESDYRIPDVLIEAFRPAGLKVSIPDQQGIKMFAFHGKINQFIVGREEGTLSKDVIQPVDGRWTYFNETVELEMGNIIYYWVKVDHLIGNQRRGYFKDNQGFTVTELITKDTTNPTAGLTTRLISTTPREVDFDVPKVSIEVFTPKGLKISIPDVDGIKQFSFHGKINKPMLEREEGTFSRDVTRTHDGRWTFSDKTARLTVGDVINYWVKVDYYDGIRRVSRYRDNQSFTVTELLPVDGTGDFMVTTTTTTSTTERTTTESGICGGTPTLVKGKPSCQGKLIFEETFSELSDKKWFQEVKFASDPDYEFVVYTNERENLYLGKSMLHIKPTLLEDKYGAGFAKKTVGLNLGENCTGVAESSDCVQKPRAWIILPPVLSAQISTKNYFSFVYGVVEIRARLPEGDWIYPELYLKPKNDDYGLGYDSGLIKIAFTPGNNNLSTTLSGGGVLGQSVAARNYAMKTLQSERNWNADFHVFKVEWKTDSITLSVDNQIYGNVYPPDEGFASDAIKIGLEASIAKRWKKGSELAPFDKEMYIILGVGVGGPSFSNKKTGYMPWDNDDPKAQLKFYRAQDVWSKTWTDRSDLVIDYVRVWAI